MENKLQSKNQALSMSIPSAGSAGGSHKLCIVCEEWKHKSEMTSTDVCNACFETHDKFGMPNDSK